MNFLLDSVLGFPTLVSRILWKPVIWLFSSDWSSRDVGSSCGESWNRLQTVLHMCICVYLYVCGYMYVYIYIYIYISFLFNFQFTFPQLFRGCFLSTFQLFRWYLLISISLLTCIQGIFKFNFVLYLFLLLFF